MEAPKITPFLWFNGNAEEAVDFYVSVFPGSRKTGGLPGPGGKPLTIAFELGELPFTALNGGPNYSFNRAVSFVVPCEDQEEIDYYWGALTADGGRESQCGWLEDKFGLPWQIVVGPKGLANGIVELKRRATGDREELTPADAVAKVRG